jgi:hypothetical protein
MLIGGAFLIFFIIFLPNINQNRIFNGYIYVINKYLLV